MDPTATKWWDGSTFPPLSIFSGGMDFLVLTEPLLDRLENEESDVRLLRYKRQEEAEHCDHFWAADAVEWCFHDILQDIEATRPRYPEETKNNLLHSKISGSQTNGSTITSVLDDDAVRTPSSTEKLIDDS